MTSSSEAKRCFLGACYRKSETVRDGVGLSTLGLLDRVAVGTPVGRLSEGQRRRLHLALELAARPNLVLLDEPTNHLSATLVDELTAAVRATAAAVVVATHDRQLLRDLADWPRLHLKASFLERPREAGSGA